MSQLALFESAGQPAPNWTVADIWTPSWNKAINLAIVEACSEDWKTLAELDPIRIAFGGVGHTPFAMQVVYVQQHLHQLKVQVHPKTYVQKWRAA